MQTLCRLFAYPIISLPKLPIQKLVVVPGLTETDATSLMPQANKDMIANFIPLRRIGMPEDVAGAVLFYASDESKFITGSYQPVNGGAIML